MLEAQTPDNSPEGGSETTPRFDLHRHAFKMVSTVQFQQALETALAQLVPNKHGVRVLIDSLDFKNEHSLMTDSVRMALRAELRTNPRTDIFGG